MKTLLRFSVLAFLFFGSSVHANGIEEVVGAVGGILKSAGVENVQITDQGVSASGETAGVGWGVNTNGGSCGNNCGSSGLIFAEDRPPSIFSATHGENSFRRVVVNIVNFILFFLGLIAMIMVTYGGFLYLTAGGEEGQQGKAKSILLYAAIGIFVILAAFSLSNTLLTAAEPDATGDPEGVGYEN